MPELVITLTDSQAAVLAALPSRWDTSVNPAVLAPMLTLRHLWDSGRLKVSAHRARRVIGTLQAYGLVECDDSRSPFRYRRSTAASMGRIRGLELASSRRRAS